MSQVSNILRKVQGGYAHWCEGCDCVHIYEVPRWTFNGNVKKPSFTPSMRIFHPAHKEEDKDVPEKTICHYFVTDGKIKYCGDCDHELSGEEVPLVPIPKTWSFGRES